MRALEGISVIELGGMGPGPFAAMLLADMGAEVVRIDRPGRAGEYDPDPVLRGRRSLLADLKRRAARDAVLALTARSDVVIETFRPGVAERLGLGPKDCRGGNPLLVYARMTGWGQDGPRAAEPGHDINYVGMTGALHAIGPSDRPPAPPLNLVGDFGGGGAILAFGILAALIERGHSGSGQVIDAAMIDGIALTMSGVLGMLARGEWHSGRGANILDGSAPYYTTYEAADGHYLAVGAIEPRFYSELLDGLGLDPEDWPQGNRDAWPKLRALLARRFAERPLAQWLERFAGRDACVTPVLSVSEAEQDPQLATRGTYTRVNGALHPAPAPRLGRTPATSGEPICFGAGTRAVLSEAGLEDAEVEALHEMGAVESPESASTRKA